MIKTSVLLEAQVSTQIVRCLGDTYDDGVRGDAFFNDLARRIRTCYCSISSASSDLTSAAANKMKGQRRGCYLRMLDKVVDEADVTLVPGACDPAGCCSRLLQEGVLYAGRASARSGGKASLFLCSTNRCVNPIFQPHIIWRSSIFVFL